MPVPNGEISTSQIWQQPVEEELPEVTEEDEDEVQAE